jgi:hypothetical protein
MKSNRKPQTMPKRGYKAAAATPEIIEDYAKAKAVLPEIPTVEVKEWDTKGNTFAEIWSNGTEMALLTEDMKMVHPYVFCKDFMTDVFWAIANNRNTSIYGFAYNLTQANKPDMNKLRIVVQNVDYKASSIPARAAAVQSFLNSAESKLGFKGRTKTYLVSNPENAAVPVVYVESPKEWREDIPLKFSMFTMFIRMSFDAGKAGEDVLEALERIITEGKARDVRWSKPAIPLIKDIFEKGFETALSDFAKRAKHKVVWK